MTGNKILRLHPDMARSKRISGMETSHSIHRKLALSAEPLPREAKHGIRFPLTINSLPDALLAAARRGVRALIDEINKGAKSRG